MHLQNYIKGLHCKVLIFIQLLYFTDGNISLSGNVTSDETIEVTQNTTVNNISEALIALMTNEPNERMIELKDKLADINKYVIDNEEVNKLLINLTKESSLNETNFYKSLIEEDHFRLIPQTEPKNLYLKLKEKVNRDDVLSIVRRRGGDDVLRSARKSMPQEFLGKDDKDIMNDVVDKMIAETPKDNHKFNFSINDSMYWDPQNELEDLRDYHKHDGRRIYKGERTTVRYYPFMVSVHVMGRFWCGGVLYWYDLVLTSSSCLQLMHNNRFFRENPKVLQVRVGSNHSRIGGEMVDALEVYFHPGYSPRTLNNNIALIRLRRHLFFNYHRIPKIIAVSSNDQGLPATAEVLLLGWGVSKMSQKMSYEPIFLQRKFLPVYPNKFCKEVYGDKFITRTMFCAGTMTTGEGACDHDAGGPAVFAGRLVGIISFGPAVCGFPNAPTVFTLAGTYLDWMESINESMPTYYRGKKKTTTTTPSPLLDLLEHWPKNQQQVNNFEMFTPVPATEVTYVSPISEPTAKRKLRMKVESEEGWSIDEKK